MTAQPRVDSRASRHAASDTPGPGSPGSPWPWALLAIDMILVLVFAAAGNRSHSSGLALVDVLRTGTPFLAGLVLSCLALRFWRHPSRLWPDGVAILAGTVAVGMALRVALGLGGAQWTFVLVTVTVLGALLLGRRLLSTLVSAHRGSRGSSTA